MTEESNLAAVVVVGGGGGGGALQCVGPLTLTLTLTERASKRRIERETEIGRQTDANERVCIYMYCWTRD